MTEFTEYKQSLDYTQTQVDNQKNTGDVIATMCRDAPRDINMVCKSALKKKLTISRGSPKGTTSLLMAFQNPNVRAGKKQRTRSAGL